jgi:hypothetical protein
MKMKTFNYVLVAGDTDGIAFKKADESPFTDEERREVLEYLNSQMPELIRWEDDGVFPRQLVVAAKNYVLIDSKGKRKVKGSGLKATTKEKALQKFVQDVIELLVTDKEHELASLYYKYAREILSLTDISKWCSKHTVTKAVLTGKGTAQVRLREALRGRTVQEGDKFYTFFKTPTERCLLENFDGTYDVSIMLGKLYDTLKIFKTVLDLSQIPDLTLKRNKTIREGLCQSMTMNVINAKSNLTSTTQASPQ